MFNRLNEVFIRVMGKHPGISVIYLLLIAALLSAAFLLTNPGAHFFAVTGEEGIARQLLAVFQWAFHWMRPLPKHLPQVAVAHTDQVPFGVNTFLDQEVEPQKREQTLHMVKAAGFQWIRQSFPWYDIEIHSKGDFEDRRHEPYRSAWEKYDHIVMTTVENDLDIIARLEAPPDWSRYDGNARGAFGPPDDLTDFGDYVTAVASRYREQIDYYQIWNEPNIYPEWGNQKVDPVSYTELLCMAYRMVKEADPTSVVISGAMAPTVELGTWNHDYDGNNMMDVIFLQRMYDAGAGNCFDIMAVNDYMLWSGPSDKRMRVTQVNFSRPIWVRDVMVANGDAAKPIWISEMNSNAVPENLDPRFGRVTLAQQARYAPLAFERIQKEWPWVGVTTVWFFKPVSDVQSTQPFYYFRLVEPDFTPLPVYNSLMEYMNGLEPILYAGNHQESSWQLYYTGRWNDVSDESAILGAYRQSYDPEASLVFLWRGRYLVLDPGSSSGVLKVTREEEGDREMLLDGQRVLIDQNTTLHPKKVRLSVVNGTVSIDSLIVR